MNSVHETLVKLLNDNQARFRLIAHPAEGRSEEVAAIRGTAPEQGAKAMTCEIKGSARKVVLAVLPGNKKIDMKKLGAHFGVSKAQFLNAEEAQRVTGCVIGSIPPFALNNEIKLVVDPSLVNDNKEIAFNAARLDFSIVLNSEDYVRIAKPELVEISM